jgi:hypothetical protein
MCGVFSHRRRNGVGGRGGLCSGSGRVFLTSRYAHEIMDEGMKHNVHVYDDDDQDREVFFPRQQKILQPRLLSTSPSDYSP